MKGDNTRKTAHYLQTKPHCVQVKDDVPNYIQSLLSINQLARPLCLGDKMFKLKEHRWKLKSNGYRSLHITAPCYWNSLPANVCNIELDLNDFKKRLNTFLFYAVFPLESTL